MSDLEAALLNIPSRIPESCGLEGESKHENSLWLAVIAADCKVHQAQAHLDHMINTHGTLRQRYNSLYPLPPPSEDALQRREWHGVIAGIIMGIMFSGFFFFIYVLSQGKKACFVIV
jgi:hypothetical protein